MSRDLHAIIRAALLAAPDGLTRTQLARAHDIALSSVIQATRSMPDVYIDRWLQPKGSRDEPVFVAVPIPEDCPPPERRANWRSKNARVNS